MRSALPCSECDSRPVHDEGLCLPCWNEMADRSHARLHGELYDALLQIVLIEDGPGMGVDGWAAAMQDARLALARAEAELGK